MIESRKQILAKIYDIKNSYNHFDLNQLGDVGDNLAYLKDACLIEPLTRDIWMITSLGIDEIECPEEDSEDENPGDNNNIKISLTLDDIIKLIESTNESKILHEDLDKFKKLNNIIKNILDRFSKLQN